MLIVLRGNSGSGKSTTALLLRDAAFSRGGTRRIAIVEQDYLRRFVLKEKESEGRDNISLIYQTVVFALEHGYDVILEGILYAPRYENMLKLLHKHTDDIHLYYFDVSFEETMRRHAQKPNSAEFGKTEMREWYKHRDMLGWNNEKVLPESLSQPETVQRILKETGL